MPDNCGSAVGVHRTDRRKRMVVLVQNPEPASKEQKCLEQLVAVNASPAHVLLGIFILNVAKIIAALGTAAGVVILAAQGVSKWLQ
jgi:hypothetical protein